MTFIQNSCWRRTSATPTTFVGQVKCLSYSVIVPCKTRNYRSPSFLYDPHLEAAALCPNECGMCLNTEWLHSKNIVDSPVCVHLQRLSQSYIRANMMHVMLICIHLQTHTNPNFHVIRSWSLIILIPNKRLTFRRIIDFSFQIFSNSK